MIQGYLDYGMTESAVFEFFVRRMPKDRNFLVAAGLEEVLDYLIGLRFDRDEIEWLKSTRRYGEKLLSYLSEFRFTGDVWAMPEGEIFFAGEPLLRVKAPLPEAQLIETRLINLLQLPILVASKAARCVLVSEGTLLIDFGLRRAHGAEAGLFAARAAYLAGFHGTSTVLAGRRFGVPVHGTMAHSFIEAHDDESTAFEHFARSNPERLTLLIDTYDTEAAARKLKEVASRLSPYGISIQGVRLDSGDLGEHARRVRTILDASGLNSVRIFASGSIDEFSIRSLMKDRAPIDGFGVGTHLTTSQDVPFLDCAYKLQEYAGRPRWKLSEGKATLPGSKQVHRIRDRSGNMLRDRVTLEDERSEGEILLHQVMAQGRILGRMPTLDESRQACLTRIANLPASLKSIINPHIYPVETSRKLTDMVVTPGPNRRLAA